MLWTFFNSALGSWVSYLGGLITTPNQFCRRANLLRLTDFFTKNAIFSPKFVFPHRSRSIYVFRKIYRNYNKFTEIFIYCYEASLLFIRSLSLIVKVLFFSNHSPNTTKSRFPDGKRKFSTNQSAKVL